MSRGRRARGGRPASASPPPQVKAAITSACESLIEEVLKPRFLPEVRPRMLNYPIDICGKWHGNKYRFIQRYHSGLEHEETFEFDAPFTRLDYVGPDCFDLSYFRHTQRWFCLYRSLSFKEALDELIRDELLHPL